MNCCWVDHLIWQLCYHLPHENAGLLWMENCENALKRLSRGRSCRSIFIRVTIAEESKARSDGIEFHLLLASIPLQHLAASNLMKPPIVWGFYDSQTDASIHHCVDFWKQFWDNPNSGACDWICCSYFSWHWAAFKFWTKSHPWKNWHAKPILTLPWVRATYICDISGFGIVLDTAEIWQSLCTKWLQKSEHESEPSPCSTANCVSGVLNRLKFQSFYTISHDLNHLAILAILPMHISEEWWGSPKDGGSR